VNLTVLLATLFRTPKLDERQIDEDAEEAEEEGLLASTGRRFNATWQDLTGQGDRRTIDGNSDV
jgi:LMBR1 domain-containing protein 1